MPVITRTRRISWIQPSGDCQSTKNGINHAIGPILNRRYGGVLLHQPSPPADPWTFTKAAYQIPESKTGTDELAKVPQIRRPAATAGAGRPHVSTTYFRFRFRWSKPKRTPHTRRLASLIKFFQAIHPVLVLKRSFVTETSLLRGTRKVNELRRWSQSLPRMKRNAESLHANGDARKRQQQSLETLNLCASVDELPA
ncbi:hypothetical protein T440DRAFT_515944 [Plenodomus tracheiphilus IPT5]|uniref:Uncharacterized protein n=1 Tax=Plenodomus tracheiphilus IPT5 TaxID=1408161 RepID=A0A6A7BGE0_9PLEO|nr:hypothetical protein T440DRAFT_515944 [Plenodomus tracheiphilus IPT5]